MGITHTHVSAVPNDPTKDVSSDKWNAEHAISMTKAELDAAISDGNVQFVGDAPTAHTHPWSEVTGKPTISGTNTGDETAAGILAKLLTVDGAGSGLDADMLDGQSAAAFATAAQGALAASASQPGHTHTAANITDFATAVAATAAVAANTAKTSNATHTGDVTGATALTIAAGAVTLAKQANVATARIMGRATAGTGSQEALTGTQATALLDTVTSGAKGLAPASGGGTVNYLRADGTWATPAAGAAGSSGQLQYNDAGALAGATEVEIEGNQLRLDATTSFTAPAAGGVKLIGVADAGRTVPAFLSQDGVAKALQSELARTPIMACLPQASNSAFTVFGMSAQGTTGTVTNQTISTSSRFLSTPRIDLRVTSASTSAVVNFRSFVSYVSVGGPSAGLGGFSFVTRWGPSTGVSTATHCAFWGLGPTGAASDVDPSTLINQVGMGWDAADTNVQIMHNSGAGTATKIDLGASFPKPSVDQTLIYELSLYSPKGTTQSVEWCVKELTTGAVATGTITSNLPATANLIGPRGYMSVGGTSSVIGLSHMGFVLDPLLN